MKKLKFILLLSLFILGCKSDKKIERNNLIGDWSEIEEITNNYLPPPPPGYTPFGIGFTREKIEIFRGFKRYDEDSISKKRQLNYKGTFTDYKLRFDSIFIKNPFNQVWEFKWKIKKLLNDTLILTINDTNFFKLQRNKYDSNINFDQIIFSRSGCYGSCPIIDISIDNNHKVYFQGEGFVKPLGFYESKIDSVKTNYIFSKFGKANIENLLNDYIAGRTDDESISTTFIKNGKIIKTIHDYGKVGPKELVWAYVSIENLYTQIKLDSLTNNHPNYATLSYLNFENSIHFLPLEKSESFFLWTEINKSKIVNEIFNSRYSITFWESDLNENIKPRHKIDKIETDGKFFKFYFKGREPITYDLGYNFIERNFIETDFTNKTK